MTYGHWPFNPLSAIWRIYPSSKWSSQWLYDGYIRHKWMTSCGRGRDSATRECLGEALKVRFSSEARNYLFSFQSYVRFEEFFCFPRFWKIWRQTLKLWGFWFRRCLGGLFENSAPSPGIFLRTPTTWTTTTSIFLKISFLFSKTEPRLLAWPPWRSPSWAKHFGDGTSKTRMKTWLPWRWRDRAQKDHGSSLRLARVVYGDPWSKREKKKKKKKKKQGSQRVIVRRLNPSSSTNQRVLKSLFPRPDVATVSHFAVFVDVDVQLQDGEAAARESEEKQSSVTFRYWSLRRNELECTNLVRWTGALHRFSSRDAIIVVGFVLEKHFGGDFTRDQEKEITFKRWPPGYQSWKLGLALNGLTQCLFICLGNWGRADPSKRRGKELFSVLSDIWALALSLVCLFVSLRIHMLSPTLVTSTIRKCTATMLTHRGVCFSHTLHTDPT